MSLFMLLRKKGKIKKNREEKKMTQKYFKLFQVYDFVYVELKFQNDFRNSCHNLETVLSKTRSRCIFYVKK